LNGSGKSTLLDLIVHLLGKPWNEIDGWGTYDLEFELTFNTGEVIGRIKGTPSTLKTRQEQKTGQGKIEAKYTMHLEGHPQPYQITYDGERLDVAPQKTRATIGWHSDPLSVLNIIAKAWVAATGETNFLVNIGEGFVPPNYRYEEGLETLHRIEQAEHQLTSTGEPWLNQEGWTIPSLITKFYKIGKNNPDVSDIDIDSSSDEGVFLRNFVEYTGIASATLHLDRKEKRMFKQNSYVSTYGNFQCLIKRKDGSEHFHDKLSRGQKRLLSFLYFLEANRDIVVADELVNDFHHAWIENCIGLISHRQAILTSQNPLLFDHVIYESQEQVKTSFILCSTGSQDGREELVWRNPTDDEAESFFAAYRAGVQYVGEILRSKGLW
jgi:hypothetical protein